MNIQIMILLQALAFIKMSESIADCPKKRGKHQRNS